MNLYIGTFLIAFSTLALEITLSRLISVSTWYYLAFFAISTAMLGMTAGATTVYLKKDQIERRPLNDTVALAIGAILLFSLTTWFALAWLIRNVGLPRGAFLVVMVVPAFFQTVLESLRPANLLLGPVIAAMIAELTWPRLAPMLRRSAAALAGWAAGLVAVTWLGLFAGAALRSDLGWQIELWGGSSVLAALLVGLFIVSTDPALPQRAEH